MRLLLRFLLLLGAGPPAPVLRQQGNWQSLAPGVLVGSVDLVDLVGSVSVGSVDSVGSHRCGERSSSPSPSP